MKTTSKHLPLIAALGGVLLATLDAKEPIKVFVLAGQSNMQGHGRIAMGKDGDLDYAAKQEAFAYLKKAGAWAERDDVWYHHTSGKGEVIKSKLKPGLGSNATSVGPELAFGHVLGDHFDEPVLLIKCAWGGQAIGMTFRPPGAGMPDYLDEKFQGANMTHFIRDMCKDLGNQDLPLVIATSGMGGPGAAGVAGGLGKNIEPAQVNAAKKFKNCTAVETRQFQKHKPGRQKSHWHNSAESYVLVGDAAGKAMVELLKK